MDKICCIVLNYNDAPTTLSLTEELMASRLLTDLVVVDNCSTDDSWERLAVLKNRSAHERSAGSKEGGKRAWGPAVHLLRTEKNGGYGAGNQTGIDYAMANLAPDYIAIANPDIHVSDRCIFRVKEALRRQENGAAASAWVKAPRAGGFFLIGIFCQCGRICWTQRRSAAGFLGPGSSRLWAACPGETTKKAGLWGRCPAPFLC